MRDLSIIGDAAVTSRDTEIPLDGRRIAEANSLVERAQDDDPTVAAEAAALLESCAPDDHCVRSIALRAWGIAVRWTQNIDRSIELLRSSVDEAKAAGTADLVADSMRSLAGSLALSGDSEAALAALDSVTVGASPLASARLESQRATILARIGRAEEADRAYTRSLETFRDQSETPFIALTLANRGLLRLMSGRARDANDDIEAALAIYLSQGNALSAVTTRHNLGHVALYRGQLARSAADLFRDGARDRASHGWRVRGAGESRRGADVCGAVR